MSENFFRFPLALLAMHPDSPEDTLQTIVSFCMVEVGLKTFGHQGIKELRSLAAEYDAEKAIELNLKTQQEYAVFMGAKTLNVSPGTINASLHRHSEAESFLVTASPASVANRINVSTEWFWSCHSTIINKEVARTIQWREFRVLCALLSKIGCSKYGKCGWQEIAARAAGWCGKADRKKAHAVAIGRRKGLVLTREQIRATLTRLESDKFFARFQYRRAESWFSFSCDGDRETLVKWVSNQKARRAETLRIQREKDALDSAVVLARKGINHLPTTINTKNHLTTTINGKGEKTTTINGRRKKAILPPPHHHLTTTSPPPHQPPHHHH